MSSPLPVRANTVPPSAPTTEPPGGWLAVGIDLAKASFVAACWARGQTAGEVLGTFANTPEGFGQLAATLCARLAQGTGAQLVLEPTGGYELPVAHFALAQGWAVSLPNARRVHDWGRGLGQRAKTDRQDALLLARYGAECQPPQWHPLPAELSELESLQRRKEELEQLLRQERNRVEQLAPRPHVAPSVPRSLGRVIAALEEELAGIEQVMVELLRQHPPLQAARTRLLALPAVGPATVIPLLLVLARWHSLTQGQGQADGLVAYAGLDPQPYSSGTSVHRRAAISRQGSPRLRAHLFMGVLGGVRGNNPLRVFYQRLVSRGKPKKVALVAAMRKVLIWAWQVYRTGQPYDPAKLAHLSASIS